MDSTVPAAGSLKLVVVSGAEFVRYELPAKGSVVLGRSERSDVRIDDPSITRRHARLHLGERVEIEDLGSVNGTMVRGQRIAPGARVALFRGEAFHLGAALVVVHAVDEPPPAPSAQSSEVATRRDHASPARGGAIAPIIHDAAMHELYALVDRVAAGNINVLIVGETGAGKELVAERVHERSRRRDKPLLRLNCAAVAESLLEAELFGYERGAFTGATQAKPGLLEAVQGGTLLLDEVGEMPLVLQAKMLRAVESREITRVGGLSPRPVDVRFVAATNRDLEERVRAGSFREDLFFRLNGALVVVPPLRQRPSEIEPLAAELVRATCQDLGRPAPRISAEALRMLQLYAWPGNVRELKNFLERAVLVAPGSVLLPEHFPIRQMASTLPVHRVGADARASSAPASARALASDPGGLERERILAVLAECGGNQSRAARALGISRTTLVGRLDGYEVPRPRKP